MATVAACGLAFSGSAEACFRLLPGEACLAARRQRSTQETQLRKVHFRAPIIPLTCSASVFHPGDSFRFAGHSARICAIASHSTIIRSAHSTSDTKIAVVPNFAAQLLKSVSVTPRAREQAPQENTGMCLATTFSRNSLSAGQATG